MLIMLHYYVFFQFVIHVFFIQNKYFFLSLILSFETLDWILSFPIFPVTD